MEVAVRSTPSGSSAPSNAVASHERIWQHPAQRHVRDVQSDSANLSPSSTVAKSRGLSRPTRSERTALSMVINCDTFTTEGFDSPEPRTGICTFPGAAASLRFDVMTAAITVLIRLSLKAFAETMRKDLRKPGPEPAGSGTEAHQISPLRATTSLWVANRSATERQPDRETIARPPVHRSR